MLNEHTKRYAWVGIVAAALIVGGLLYSRRAAHAPIEVLLQNVPYEVAVSGSTFAPAVGEAATLEFAVTLDDQPIDLGADKVYPHAYVVSEDLKDVWFYHIDSLEQVRTGVYQFTHTFTRPTAYTVWIEFNDNKTRDHHGSNSDFIGRFSIAPKEIQGDSSIAEPSQVVSAQNYIAETSYTLRLLPYKLSAGQPGTFTVVAEDQSVKQVPILPQFDHFFAIASGGSGFYVLDHPQPTDTGETEAVIGPYTFPRPGRYAMWIRLFPDDGTAQVTDAIEGVLVLDVQ